VVVAEAAFVAIGGMALMVATVFLALAVTGGVIYAVAKTIGPEDHE
jgi:putative flippase GtrA